MGPSEAAMDLADTLIEKFKLTVDRYELGYAIDAWADKELDE